MIVPLTSYCQPFFERLGLFVSSKYVMLCVWLVLSCVVSTQVFAEPSTPEQVPEFYVGSIGNEVLLSLLFENGIEESTDIELALEEASGVALNVEVVQRKNLASVSERVFAITFDIATNIKPGIVEKLLFVPSSNQILSYDKETLQFSFRILGIQPKVPIYRLVSIEPRYNREHLYGFEHQVNSSGYSKSNTHKGKTKTFSAKLTEFPREIIPGEPFEIAGEAVQRVETVSGWPWCSSSKRSSPGSTMQLSAGTELMNSTSTFMGARFKGRTDFTIYCSDGTKLRERRGLEHNAPIEAVKKEERMSFRVQYTSSRPPGDVESSLPTEDTNTPISEQADPYSFFYTAKITADANAREIPGPEWLIHYIPDKKERERWKNWTAIIIGDLRFVYKPVATSIEIADYEHPEGSNSKPSGQEADGSGPSGTGEQGTGTSSSPPTSQEGTGTTSEPGGSGDLPSLPEEQREPEEHSFGETSGGTGTSGGDDPGVDLGPYPTSGPYTTTEGELTFLDSGPLAAHYHQDGGRLVGKFDGLVFTGVWVESNSKRKCANQKNGSAYWGKVQFTFTESFDVFKGVWGYCEDVPAQKWDGTRKRTGTATEPDQESSSSTLEEQEPNNSLDTAQAVTLPTRLQGFIDPKRDADWYRLAIPAQGALEVAITNMPQEVNVTFQVWGANKKVVHGWQTAQKLGVDHIRIVDLPAPGTYYLELRDSSDNGRSAQPYTLRTVLTATKDTGEPNNTLATATPLKLEQSIQANILPKRDADWYRLAIPAQGALEVAITNMPQEVNVTFQVWGANKKVVHGWQTAQKPGVDHIRIVDLPAPGTYYLELRDSSDNGRSAQPYTLGIRGILKTGQGIGIDRPGRDYRNFLVGSSKECQNACNAEAKCQAWTYVKPGIQGASARCWLKHSVPEPVRNRCCTSGIK